MWYTIMVTAWIGESHLLKWQKSSIAQNYIELPHFIMRHRQAVRQRTLTPPSQVRLLLAQLDKTPHGCLEHQVSMRGFFVSAFRRIKKGPSLWGKALLVCRGNWLRISPAPARRCTAGSRCRAGRSAGRGCRAR